MYLHAYYMYFQFSCWTLELEKEKTWTSAVHLLLILYLKVWLIVVPTFKNAIFYVKHLKVHMTNSLTAEVHKQFSFGPKSESLQTAIWTSKLLTFGVLNTYVVHFRVWKLLLFSLYWLMPLGFFQKMEGCMILGGQKLILITHAT